MDVVIQMPVTNFATRVKKEMIAVFVLKDMQFSESVKQLVSAVWTTLLEACSELIINPQRMR